MRLAYVFQCLMARQFPYTEYPRLLLSDDWCRQVESPMCRLCSSILHSLASSFLQFLLPVACTSPIGCGTILSCHASHGLSHPSESGISKPNAVKRYHTPKPPSSITNKTSHCCAAPGPIQHIPQIFRKPFGFEILTRLFQFSIGCCNWASYLLEPELYHKCGR